jgi:hypothetical protein
VWGWGFCPGARRPRARVLLVVWAWSPGPRVASFSLCDLRLFVIIKRIYETTATGLSPLIIIIQMIIIIILLTGLDNESNSHLKMLTASMKGAACCAGPPGHAA